MSTYVCSSLRRALVGSGNCFGAHEMDLLRLVLVMRWSSRLQVIVKRKEKRYRLLVWVEHLEVGARLG